MRGVGATVLQNTLGGTSQTLSAGGAPGTVGGATAGVGGVVLSVDGAGPVPEQRDPVVGGTIQFERAKSPQTTRFAPRAIYQHRSYNFTYGQGFVTGTSATLGWNNRRDHVQRVRSVSTARSLARTLRRPLPSICSRAPESG